VRRATLGFFLTVLGVMPNAFAEEAVRVSACELLQNPAAYDHSLVEVEGRVSRGFEDFTLDNSGCKQFLPLWLDFGGTLGAGIKYAGGKNERGRRDGPLIVEGIETTLVEDAALSRFQLLTRPKRGYGHAKVRVIGRFFAGRKIELDTGTFWGGFGHMGFHSLLVIQQVRKVSP
jgi:hypothetical protein